MAKYRDIPQLTRPAYYRVTMPWWAIEKALEDYNSFGTLQLDPPFQRAHVWTDQQRIAYVEFILRGGDSSKEIHFNQADWMTGFKAPMYLVDGKQRLEAVRRFMCNDLAIFGGLLCNDFEDSLPLEAAFIFHVNNLQTYAEVLQWYIDLNAGGVAHTEEEIARVRILLIAEQSK